MGHFTTWFSRKFSGSWVFQNQGFQIVIKISLISFSIQIKRTFQRGFLTFPREIPNEYEGNEKRAKAKSRDVNIDVSIRIYDFWMVEWLTDAYHREEQRDFRAVVLPNYQHVSDMSENE